MTHKSASSARNDIGGASQWPINKESPKFETDCIKKSAQFGQKARLCAFYRKYGQRRTIILRKATVVRPGAVCDMLVS